VIASPRNVVIAGLAAEAAAIRIVSDARADPVKRQAIEQ